MAEQTFPPKDETGKPSRFDAFKKKTKRFLWISLVVVILIGAGLFSLTTFTCFSKGKRDGTVTKLSKKGIMFKTWEGELMKSQFQAVGEHWTFTVVSDEVAAKIEKAMLGNQPMVLVYCERYYKFPWQGDTKYFVEDVETAK